MSAPGDDSEGHLATLRALERHCRDERKAAAYERMLIDFGIAPEAFAELAQHPRLVLAEQPGCWFYAEDLLRHRLLRALVDTAGFHPASGVLSLGHDALSDRGVKRWFITFELFSGLRPVPLLGSTYLRRHRHLTYQALSLTGAAYRRLAVILATAAAMLEAALSSPAAFAVEMNGRFQAGLDFGIRPLLPPATDRRSLLEFGARLAEFDLVRALRPLIAARRALRDGISWCEYWNVVNSAFLGEEVGQLGTLFNRFLLTVEDPVRMARTLLRECRHPAREPIAVAAIITPRGKYRMVFFDPATEDFFYPRAGGERREIGWEEVRTLAASGRTGGPSGTLEYLMMAAAGLYLVSDPGDGHSRFESAARAIHRRLIGLAFPSIALPPESTVGWSGYLDIYTPAFEARAQAAVARFCA